MWNYKYLGRTVGFIPGFARWYQHAHAGDLHFHHNYSIRPVEKANRMSNVTPLAHARKRAVLDPVRDDFGVLLTDNIGESVEEGCYFELVITLVVGQSSFALLSLLKAGITPLSASAARSFLQQLKKFRGSIYMTCLFDYISVGRIRTD